jgi:hypothetical protein
VGAPVDPSGGGRFEIRVRGLLAPRWSDWFEGFALRPDDDGTTVLDGYVVDQAALHGVLRTLADLGLPLLSISPLDGADTTPRTTS